MRRLHERAAVVNKAKQTSAQTPASNWSSLPITVCDLVRFAIAVSPRALTLFPRDIDNRGADFCVSEGGKGPDSPFKSARTVGSICQKTRILEPCIAAATTVAAPA